MISPIHGLQPNPEPLLELLSRYSRTTVHLRWTICGDAIRFQKPSCKMRFQN